MTDLQRIEQALLAADKAGDVEAAKLLAAEYRRLQESSAAPVPAAGASMAAAGAAGAPTGTGSEPPDESSLGTLVKRGIPQIAAATAKGAAGLALLPGELLRAGVNKIAGDPADFGRATGMVSDAIDQVIPPPKTKAGKAAVNVTSGALGGGLFGAGSRLRNAITGATSSAGGEVGAAVGEDVAGDNGRIIGGVLGSLTGGAPMTAVRGRGTEQQMLADALKGLTPGDFAAARRLRDDATRSGVQLTPDQLFDKASGLDELFSQSLRSGAGSGKLQSRVMGQPDTLAAVTSRGGNQLGAAAGTPQATRDLRLAAEGAIDDVELTPAQKALYERRGLQAPGDRLDELDAKLASLADSFKADPKVVARIEAIRRQILDVSDVQQFTFGSTTKVAPAKAGGAAKWTQKQVPNQVNVNLGASAADLDTIVKNAKAELDDLGIGTPATARLQTGKTATALKEVKQLLDDLLPTRPQANQLYQSMQSRRDALTASLVGRLAGKGGVHESVPDSMTALQAVLGGDKAKASEIAELAAALRARAARARREGDVEGAALATRALPQAARDLWDQAAGKAFHAADGRVNPRAGSVFADALIGTPAKEANFKALMQAVAVDLGQSPKEFTDGMLTMLRALRASGRNRAGVNYAAADIRDLQGQSLARDAVRAAGPLSRPQMITEKLRDFGYKRQYAKLAEMFDDPNALEMIEALGKTPPVSSQRAAILTTLLSTLSQPGRQAEGEPNVP